MIKNVGLSNYALELVAMCEMPDESGFLTSRMIIALLDDGQYVVSRQCVRNRDEAGEPIWLREWCQGHYHHHLADARADFVDLIMKGFVNDKAVRRNL